MNEEHKEQLAQWFENCGLEEIDIQTVANIIRKWIPEEEAIYYQAYRRTHRQFKTNNFKVNPLDK